jgi:Kef-type K+ transport system membrane component KefB
MNSIEFIIILLLLFMAVPDLCRMVRRPALIYPAFVIFGLLLGPWTQSDAGTMIQQAGQIGFLLLLFEVGLEIELPPAARLRRPLAYMLRWVAVQYPVVLALARLAGLPWLESFVAAAAITGCSVGMAHSAWKNYPGLAPDTRAFVLHVMVLLEVLAIVLLAAETTGLGLNTSWWMLVLKLLGVAVAIYLCSRIAVPFTRLLQEGLGRTTQWRIHFVILLVLAVCAVGERLGLSGAKMAFFLGLFMSRVQHDGKGLENYLAPISQRFLIPTFFVALGMAIPVAFLWSRTALLALVAAGVLIVFRETIHRRWLRTGGDANTYLLFSPNLTMVALAASAMLSAGLQAEVAAWTVLTGLFMTVIAIIALPPPGPEGPATRSP